MTNITHDKHQPNAGLEHQLEYFKNVAQRFCKHDWMLVENKDGSRFNFCRICTLRKNETWSAP